MSDCSNSRMEPYYDHDYRCPYCGIGENHEIDHWEGVELEGAIEYECVNCERTYLITRVVTFDFECKAVAQ